MIPTYFHYLDQMIAEYIKIMPQHWAEIVAEMGLDVALDLNYQITKKYTPEWYQEELNGLSAGSGIDMKKFRRLNLLPELIKAGCSMYGAWGNATAQSTGGLLQLRALDWDWKAPIKKYPTIVVYHPNDGSHSFANIGYPGLIGVITGYSDSNIGISEKVWYAAPADYSSRFGTPWTYVLRDVLQFSSDLDSALNRLINTNRTCAIHIGVGDSRTGEFRGVEYSYKQLNIYDWMTQPVYDQHPQLPGVVYWDKHVQPTHTYCYGSLLKQYYGQIGVENTIQQIAALSETGDMQIAIFDFKQNYAYVANARADGESGPDKAYQRSFVRLDMGKAFAEKL